MLVTIAGKIIQTSHERAVIEVGGLGYEVRLIAADLDILKVGDECTFFVHEHLREDIHDLYGFATPESRQLFVQLISVSGVGPKVAMTILSAVTLEQLSNAIASGNSEVLQTVSGVGRKMAERIVVDLKSKVLAVVGGAAMAEGSDAAYEGLKQLGYSAVQARDALAKLPAKLTDEERIKAALKVLGK